MWSKLSTGIFFGDFSSGFCFGLIFLVAIYVFLGLFIFIYLLVPNSSVTKNNLFFSNYMCFFLSGMSLIFHWSSYSWSNLAYFSFMIYLLLKTISYFLITWLFLKLDVFDCSNSWSNLVFFSFMIHLLTNKISKSFFHPGHFSPSL